MDRKDFQVCLEMFLPVQTIRLIFVSQIPAYILPSFPNEDFAHDVMGRFFLSADHFTLAKIHLDAATAFITGSPKDHSTEESSKLREDLYTLIDVTHNGIKITGDDFQYMWYILQIRAVALLLRHTMFGDPDDLRIYNSQFKSLGPWSRDARDTFVNTCHQTLTQEPGSDSQNLPVPTRTFTAFVGGTHQKADELLSIPAETRDPIDQARLVDDLTTIIETLDRAVIHCLPNGQAVGTMAWKRFVQGASYLLRSLFTNNLADLDSSIPLLETAVRLSNPSNPEEVSTACFRASTALAARYHYTQALIDLNRVIETTERYLLL